MRMEAVELRVKGLLFDMDGVLISSIGSVNRCWRRWAAVYGVDGAEALEIPHGTRAIEIVRALRPEIDPIEGLRVIEEMEIADTEGLTVLPGVEALLRRLPVERWAIVTSSTERLLLARLKAAGLPVPKRLVSADMVERGKPDPAPYRLGAEMLGVRPADCLVVEDAPAGVLSGKAAGCRVLGLLGTHAAEDLREADWIAPTLLGVEVRSEDSGLVIGLEVLDRVAAG